MKHVEETQSSLVLVLLADRITLIKGEAKGLLCISMIVLKTYFGNNLQNNSYLRTYANFNRYICIPSARIFLALVPKGG